MEINGRGVNPVFDDLGHYLAVAGVEENSRNGPVIVAPEPVTVTYTAPTERVLFSPLRDANPFFHLMEALWMLAGRNDLAWPLYFNKNFGAYSDDGKTVWGAYGARWRNWFGQDQLEHIAKILQTDSESRRCVLAMWDASCVDAYGNYCDDDLRKGREGGRDVPCNTHAYFDLRGGRLNLTVCNRSNDLLWGLCGANAVHMSILLEYMAAWVGAPVGVYRQFSNNVHVYPANLPDTEQACAKVSPQICIFDLAVDASIHDYYKQGKVKPFPLVTTDIKTWDADLKLFFELHNRLTTGTYKDVFFSTVALPMYNAWRERKEKRGTGLEWARLIAAPDWRRACVDWIVRREARKEGK